MTADAPSCYDEIPSYCYCLYNTCQAYPRIRRRSTARVQRLCLGKHSIQLPWYSTGKLSVCQVCIAENCQHGDSVLRMQLPCQLVAWSWSVPCSSDLAASAMDLQLELRLYLSAYHHRSSSFAISPNCGTNCAIPREVALRSIHGSARTVFGSLLLFQLPCPPTGSCQNSCIYTQRLSPPKILHCIWVFWVCKLGVQHDISYERFQSHRKAGLFCCWG